MSDIGYRIAGGARTRREPAIRRSPRARSRRSSLWAPLFLTACSSAPNDAGYPAQPYNPYPRSADPAAIQEVLLQPSPVVTADPGKTAGSIEQFTTPPFSRETFLEVFPDLQGHVYTAAEFQGRAHMTEGAFDPQSAIRPGDRVRFWVEGDATFDVTLVITDLGFVDLPHVGETVVAGRTPPQLALELQPRLASRYIVPPQVAKLPPAPAPSKPQREAAVSAPSTAITGVGEIRRPGAPLSGERITLRRAVDAWELSDNANLRALWIFRELREGDGKRVGVVCDVLKLRQGDLQQDLPLLPGDLVVVPGVQPRDRQVEEARIRARQDYLLGGIGREDFLRALGGSGSANPNDR